MTKTFSIYRSSAGSGKTRTLAKEYIKLALQRQPDYYRHILAVTFANKATQEMKERILHYLDQFARGEKNNLTEEIKKELYLDDKTLQEKSREVLSSLLHHYSQFSISTIDAFFQKVIRAFTREAGLLGNFRLEIDNDLVLSEVIDELMDDLGKNEELTRWVVQFSQDKLLDGKNWNILDDLKNFSREIFKEEFKQVEKEILKEKEEGTHAAIMNTLRKEMAVYASFMKAEGKKALKILADNGLSVADFKNKNSGTAHKYFQAFAEGGYYEPDKPRILSSLVSSDEWVDKKGLNRDRFKQLIEQNLIHILNEMVAYDKIHYPTYKSAEVVLKNFYAFGLLANITQKLRAYQDENNLMLLSDAPQFLNGIIDNSDTPFVYEKVGSFYRHYLIDEFQDTSGFQWSNFRPLVKDSLDSGRKNLVVGDVKQSIYRWRGGDLQLLQSKVEENMGAHQTETLVLPRNFRSAFNIVSFNNFVFETASKIIAARTEDELSLNAFIDVKQTISKQDLPGYVHISFIEDQEEEEWSDIALQQLPGWLERLQDSGLRLKDIAILVRENKEGQQIAAHLLQYKQSVFGQSKYKYDVISNESLRLDTSSSVNLLVCALTYLQNETDAIAKAQLAYEVARQKGNTEHVFEDVSNGRLYDLLPPVFWKRIDFLKKLSVFELTEELIRIFSLGGDVNELAYLTTFQDLVLEFSAKEKNDISAFIEWWHSNKAKDKASIKVSGDVDAASIITIHKSKGLQFRFVIIPFCDWSLNHKMEPLLWVRSDQPPFANLGPLVVKYGSALEKTVFKSDYDKEYALAHLDNLNVLYVALTRAEEGLVVMGPKPKSASKSLSTVSDLLHQSLSANTELLVDFKEETVYEKGQLSFVKGEPLSEATTSIASYQTVDWRQGLVIKRQGAEFFQPQQPKRKKINYGILIHGALSRIQYKADVKDALEKFVIENGLNEEETTQIKQQIDKIITHKVAGDWFNKVWQVKVEVPVLLPGGRFHRIDRVITDNGKAVIIDYKTGEKKASDKKQVEEYAQALTQMGYQGVAGYLVYLTGPLEIVEVMSRNGLSLF